MIEIVNVASTADIPNSDNLLLTHVKGIPCVVSKKDGCGDYVYFPLDCVLSEKLYKFIFQKDDYTEKKACVKAKKLRGVFSEGLLIPVHKIKECCSDMNIKDLDKSLGCKKYQPPEDLEEMQKPQGKKKPWWKKILRWFVKEEYFPEYTDTKRIEKVEIPEKEFVVTIKLHGTSVRYMLQKKTIFNFWKRIFKVGSRRVCNPKQHLYFTFSKQVESFCLNIEKKLECNGVMVFGEIVGPKVQGAYSYTKTPELFVYGIYIKGGFLGYWGMENLCKEFGMNCVPHIDALTISKDSPFERWCNRDFYPNKIDKNVPCREGVVLHLSEDEICKPEKRTIFKYVSEAFRLQK